MKANSGSDSSGQTSRSGALAVKMAEVIFTTINSSRSLARNAVGGHTKFYAGKITNAAQ